MARGSSSGGRSSSRQDRGAKKSSRHATAEDEGGATVEVAAEEEGAGQRYVVLARRHRPAQFDQVIDQDHVTRTLRNAIQSDRVHHAYLFTGSRGVGKTSVARILAKALNCEKGPTATPCDACHRCRESGASVDVFEIDGASHTGVDDIRELRENVRYLPAQARHKIYIIDEVHMLSTSAFNALLKTLEEPPPHVVFIFATTEPHKIPATILSRCQRFDFKRVEQHVLVAHLERILAAEGLDVAPGGRSLIARAAEGSVRDALSLLDQVIAWAGGSAEQITSERVAEVLGIPDRRVLFELSAAVLCGDASAALRVVDRLFGQGQDLSQVAQAFLYHLRDLVVVRSCGEPEALVDATEVELADLRRQVEGDRAALLTQHFDRFARAAEEIGRSSYPRLVFEMALLEMVSAEPLLPLGGLLERLEELESRLRGAPLAGPSSAPTSTTRRGPAGRGRGDAQRPQRATTDGKNTEGRVSKTDQAEPLPVDGGPLARWQQLIARVQKEQPAVASAFASARVLVFDGERIELGFTGSSFELARGVEKRAALEEVARQGSDRPLQIVVRALRPEEEASPEMQRQSIAQREAQRRSELAAKLRQEAENHPLTKALIDRFGAEIKRIETYAEGTTDDGRA